MSAISTILKNKKLLIVVFVLLVLAIGVYYYSKSKSSFRDGLTEDTQPQPYTFTPSDTSSSSSYTPPPTGQMGEFSSQPSIDPSDLLPKDQNSQWSTLNPSLGSNNVIIPDLLQAGYHIGLDTIGQTLRNANLQLRSDPIIPKSQVSPWNNSTIEGDIGRVPLEIGYGCR
jgi:hypothetical protein